MSNKAYFFDVDGTLVDSMTRAWNEVIIKYLVDRNLLYPENLISQTVTKGFMGIANYYVNVLGAKDKPQDIYDFFMKNLEPLYVNELKLKRGAKNLIKSLKEKGYSVNVISGSPHRFVNPCLKRNGVYEYFDNVWSVEDFSLSKDDVNLYLKLAKSVDVEPKNCTIIDDSVNAIKTAKLAGFYTVGMFEAIVEKQWGEVKANADETIFDFTELL